MNNNKIIFFLTILLFGITYLSCNENKAGTNFEFEKGVNYYPLEVGKYITYELDTIIYLSQSGSTCEYFTDTSSHFLKEIVVDVFEDNSGNLNYVIERFTSQNMDGPWQITDVWNTKKTDTQVERVEENLRFIKMVFPITDGASWNGNGFFALDSLFSIGGQSVPFYQHWSSSYEYGDIDELEEINGIQFDSVMTVIQSEPSGNKINYRSSIEKYARNIGLIYKEMWILDTQCCGDLADCEFDPWEDKAEKGLILRQQVVDFN